MTKVAFNAMLPPKLPYNFTSAVTMDAADEGFASIITIPKTGTLTQVCVRTESVTIADDVLLRIETVDSSTGFPTGTLAYTDATGTLSLVNTDGSKVFWVDVNGGKGVTVTAGNVVAVLFKISYIDGNLNLRAVDTLFSPSYIDGTSCEAFPYISSYTAKAWTNLGRTPCMALAYSDGVVIPNGCTIPHIMTNFSTNTSSNPRIVGNKINLPYAVTCTGAWVANSMSRDFYIKLYGSDGATELGSISVTGAQRGANLEGVLAEYYFSSPINLLANTDYRIAVVPRSSSNMINTRINLTNSTSFAAMDALPLGSGCVYTYTTISTPTGTGDWTTDITKRMLIGIYVSEIDIGAAAAGGLLGAGGMGGGFQ